MQFDYQTPRTYSANLTFQYSLTRTLSAQASYVWTNAQSLQGGVGYQNVTQLLPAGINTKSCGAYANFPGGSCVPFPDFGGGSYQRTYGESAYNGLQTKLEQQFSNGLTFLLAYTWSKTMSDAGDLLNGGTTGGLRAFSVPGLGPRFDWAPANFDIRNVFHLSGGYQLPFGKDKRYMNTGGVGNAVLGGWAVNWIITLQGGQPLNFGCPTGTTSGTSCNDILVKGQSPDLGMKSKTIDGALKAVLDKQRSGIQPTLPIGARWSDSGFSTRMPPVGGLCSSWQQAGPGHRTGLPSLRLLDVQRIQAQRAVLNAVQS